MPTARSVRLSMTAKGCMLPSLRSRARLSISSAIFVGSGIIAYLSWCSFPLAMTSARSGAWHCRSGMIPTWTPCASKSSDQIVIVAPCLRFSPPPLSICLPTRELTAIIKNSPASSHPSGVTRSPRPQKTLPKYLLAGFIGLFCITFQ